MKNKIFCYRGTGSFGQKFVKLSLKNIMLKKLLYLAEKIETVSNEIIQYLKVYITNEVFIEI